MVKGLFRLVVATVVEGMRLISSYDNVVETL